MANTIFAEKNKIAWVGIRPGVYGEQVLGYGTANNGTTIIYTVPAGKTLLLFDTFVQYYSGTTPGGTVTLRIRNAADATVYNIYYVVVPLNGRQGTACNSRWIPIEVPENYDIVLVSSGAAAYASCHIEGILIDPLVSL